FLDLRSVHHHDAGLFRVGGVDKHFLCHINSFSRTTAAGARGAGVWYGHLVGAKQACLPEVDPPGAVDVLRGATARRIAFLLRRGIGAPPIHGPPHVAA
ncbi:MAG: hypothetical protein AAGF74_17590, partial [Pseudomonadota bacterium]